MNHVDDWSEADAGAREDRAEEYLRNVRAKKDAHEYHVMVWLCIAVIGIGLAVLACLGIQHFYLGGI